MAQEFTVEKGIEIQSEQLRAWEQLLKEEVYIALEIYAKKRNHLANDGNDIARGTVLENFVSNFLYFKKEGRLGQELGGDFAYEEYKERLRNL